MVNSVVMSPPIADDRPLGPALGAVETLRATGIDLLLAELPSVKAPSARSRISPTVTGSGFWHGQMAASQVTNFSNH